MSERCRSCQAPVMWLEHATTGKRAPIDAQTSTDGNIVILDGGQYNILARSERAEAAAEGHPLHLNHFVTCPQSQGWKKKGSR